MNIIEKNKIIAKYLANTFGGKPSVYDFWDDNHSSSIPILSCVNSPLSGVTSYSTIGLSDKQIISDSKNNLGVELVGACGTNFKNFDNALATAAFCIINDNLTCSPGVVFPDILSMYKLSSTMKHILFVPPFIWENELETISIEDKTIAWLLAIPISDEEKKFAEEKGSETLEDLFEKKQIDVYDLERRSVI